MDKSQINALLKRIQNKQITVGVIGLGYVGLPLAYELSSHNVPTIGFEVNTEKVALLQKGENYIEDLNNDLVRSVLIKGTLTATDDFSKLADCDAIYICVPTPFTPNKDPNIAFIVSASRSIRDNLKSGQIIILKSTTFPGTTEKYVQPILEESGLIAGKDFFLAYSPERIDPGNKKWNTRNTPIVVGGIEKNSTKLACEITKLAVDKVVAVSSPAIGEMEKLLENIFRSVNIALVNEMAQLCDRIGVNIWEVVDAASTKPFGFMPFYPGPGIGGHCILIDPYYLSWMAREYDFETKFITLAAETNEEMPFYVSSMVVKEIAKQPISLHSAKVLLLGMAFKKDVNDLRHSPALKVAEILLNEGFEMVDYYDPYIPEIRILSNKLFSIKEVNPEVLKKYDVVVITTDHTIIDYNSVAEHSKVVIDTRNACKAATKRDNIMLLGARS